MKDEERFNKQSGAYAKFRPRYPDSLFKFLSENCDGHNLAWDCATGNGQAACGVAGYFDKVVATDISEEQIKHAFQNEKIEYKICKAENSKFPDRSVDLITIAQALHWFDFDIFYGEVNRILKPQGIIAAWAYSSSRISPEIDKITDYYDKKFLWEYWSTKNHYVFDKYNSIPFPFKKIECPSFKLECVWDYHEFSGYLSSWSAVEKFKQVNNADPFAEIEQSLKQAWGDLSKAKSITWELSIIAGRKITIFKN